MALLWEARSLVDCIATVLKKPDNQKKIGINISEIVVGGSIGQGTIVQGHYDIDLVVFSTDIHPSKRRLTKYDYTETVKKMVDCLKPELDVQSPQQLLLGQRFKSEEFIVDLQLSPRWEHQEMEDLDDLYDFLKEIPQKDRILYSCGTAKRANRLLKQQPNRAKRLIARFKVWRDEIWPEPINGCPKSYLLSMLVLVAYQRVPEEIQEAKKFRTLANRMTDEIKKLLDEIYKNKELDLHVPGEDETIMTKYKDHLPDKPRIIDPVNPFNNLYKKGLRPIDPQGSGEDECLKRWKIFVDNIETLDLAQDSVDIQLTGRFEIGDF